MSQLECSKKTTEPTLDLAELMCKWQETDTGHPLRAYSLLAPRHIECQGGHLTLPPEGGQVVSMHEVG